MTDQGPETQETDSVVYWAHLKVFWFSYDDHTGDSERQMNLFYADRRRYRKTLFSNEIGQGFTSTAELGQIGSVNTEEVDLYKVQVKLVLPGFAVEKKFLGSAKPKPGVTECEVKFDTMSLELNACVKDKKGIPTKYNYKVNKLPGEINPNRSSAEYKKEQVILNLIKAEESSWAVTLSKSGLEQEP